jgi:hypothetical protein
MPGNGFAQAQKTRNARHPEACCRRTLEPEHGDLLNLSLCLVSGSIDSFHRSDPPFEPPQRSPPDPCFLVNFTADTLLWGVQYGSRENSKTVSGAAIDFRVSYQRC